MIRRSCWPGIVVAMLVAVPCLAANGTADSTAVRTGSSPGRGGLGGLVGGSWLFASEDFSEGAQPRFSLDARFRYVATRSLRLQVSPSFTWAAYSKEEATPFTDPAFPAETDKEGYLTQITPVNIQAQWTFGKRPWLYYIGAGPGLYRLQVQHERKVLRDPDPASLELHRDVYLGMTVEAGGERFLATLPNTSIEASLAMHYVFSEDADRFPSGWNTSLGALALRVGANFYFDLNKPKPSNDLPLPRGAQ